MTSQEVATMSVAPGDEAAAPDPSDHLTSGTWAGDWVLDPGRSALNFVSSSLWGLVKVKGQFSNVHGEGSLAPDGTATGKLEIDASSVDTGNKRRDNHLRSDDFFHASTHPEITYTVSRITPAGSGRVRVTGELTIVDHTHPLEVTASLEEADPTGATVCTEAELDRSTWGIDFKKMGMTKMATRVEGRFRFIRP
jgi:polyisoprenoid-binding protein YceI